MDMHMLVKLVFIMAAYQRNIARASGGCVTRISILNNTAPFPDKQCNIGERIRVQCAKGYLRRAGTSNVFRCKEKGGNTSWCSDLLLECIPNPRNSSVSSTKTPFSPQHFTSSTTERAARSNTTVHGTSTATTGGNAATTRTTTDSEGDKSGAFSSGYKSTVGGVTGIIILCLIAAVLLLWWRSRNRLTNRNNADPNRNVIILTNSVACTSYTSVPQSSPADNSTEDSEIFINQPQCVDT
ncbi:uncharacterized protein LOC127972663 isoform X2 [Carassius gibelio]|uniref:uncharacterized protein LOC127972663 isoform X2 n=1 Tax=Carassius gibelio TaxID=101364 RepID=UPI0022794D7C|nr:uncharacterized protein LOC127972663 isoform X2 [Carassius gibelio]